MDITQRDVMLLFTMGLAVVSMSFVFPSLGLADDSVDSNDIPEYNISQDEFDFTSEFPSVPGSPNTGELEWTEDSANHLSQEWIRGTASNGGIVISLIPPLESADRPAQVRISQYASNGSGVVYQEPLNFTSSNQTYSYRNESLGVEMTFDALEINDEDNIYRVSYEVTAQIADAGWLSSVPVIGTVVEGTQATAAVLGWFVEIVVWTVTYLFELIANAVALTVSIATYLISLLAWLTTTYTSIVSSASSWAAVFVALPGILLSTVLAKFVIIGVGLIPSP